MIGEVLCSEEVKKFLIVFGYAYPLGSWIDSSVSWNYWTTGQENRLVSKDVFCISLSDKKIDTSGAEVLGVWEKLHCDSFPFAVTQAGINPIRITLHMSVLNTTKFVS